MSIDTAPTVSATALDATSGARTRRDIAHRLLMTLGPILIALVIAGCILLAVGVDPLAYYG
ncbi:ABC transporter permease, partial [Mesorhizobium sp. M7A.F.Ca.CA.004.05.1.1]